MRISRLLDVLSRLLIFEYLCTHFDYCGIEYRAFLHAVGNILSNTRTQIHPQDFVDRFCTKFMDNSHLSKSDNSVNNET